MKLAIKKFGIPESDGHAIVDLECEPAPAIMAEGSGESDMGNII